MGETVLSSRPQCEGGRRTHRGSHSERRCGSHVSVLRRAVCMQRKGLGQPWRRPEEVSPEEALLPPDSLRGVSEGRGAGLRAGARVCPAPGARKEQLTNLTLQQVYKIAGGFAGSHGKWLQGELTATAGREGGGGCPTAPSPAPPGSAPCKPLPVSSLEAAPENCQEATMATNRNNSKTLSKRSQCSGH